MKRTLWLVPALMTSTLLISCGNRQSAQPGAQQFPQPQVGDRPATAPQVAVSPQAGPPQTPMPQGDPAQASPAAEQSGNNGTVPPPGQAPARYARMHDERAEAAPSAERPPAEAERPPAAMTIP